MTTDASTLPPLQRYLTTHTPDGKSVHISNPIRFTYEVPTNLVVGRSYAVSAIPARLENDLDMNEWNSEEALASHKSQQITIPHGANLSVVDLGPGGSSLMHQTVSIDFSICVVGTIQHELDGGEVVTLKPGDHIIQRGTMHRWSNPSKTEPARLIAVVLGCESFNTGGEPLEEKHVL